MLSFIWKILVKSKSPTFEKMHSEIEELQVPD